ncbi:hypothetical protein DFH08DRAFT_493086, partial [Mycena albidolilacea]
FRHAAQTRETGHPQAERLKKGSDLAPTRPGGGGVLSSELLPKAFVRTMNAATSAPSASCAEKTETGRKGTGRRRASGGRLTVRGIRGSARGRLWCTLTNESKDMRPLVRSAVQSSLATVRAQHKKGAAEPASSSPLSSPSSKNPKPLDPASKSKSNPTADAQSVPPPIDKHASRPKEFARASSAAPRRLNDSVQAPPELSSFAHRKSNPILSLSGNNNTSGIPAGKASILSPAQ